MPSDHDDSALHAKTAPIFVAIGHVAHHWARLEYDINRTIWALAALTPEDGACVTSQIPAILPRMRALISLVHKNECGQTLIKDLNRFAADADKLARKRARIIHDPWFFRESLDDSPGFVEFGRLEITADKRLVYEIKPQTVGDVLSAAHDIIAIHKRFITLHSRLRDELKEPMRSRLDKGMKGCPDL